MVRYEAKVLEKNEDHNPGAIQSFRKEYRIRISPELIFLKMTFLTKNSDKGALLGLYFH